MGKEPVPRERRKHKRFKTYDDLYIFADFYSGEIGQIIDISEGGLAFRCTGYPNWPDQQNKVDIVSADYVFSIKDLPVTIISELNGINENTASPQPIKRCGVHFHDLEESQKSQLRDFIESQVLKSEYLKP